MAATVRLSRFTATGHPTGSIASGRSAASGTTTYASVPTVRIADITATPGTAATARIADISAVAPVAVYSWNGTTWVLIAPTAPAPSAAHATSRASGLYSISSTTNSEGRARSAGSGTVAFTGTASLTGGGTLSPSGAPTGPSDHVGSINLSGAGTLQLTGSALVGPPGAGSLTVIPQPTNTPPRVLLELAGALGATVTINRVDVTGALSPVRTANPAPLSGGACVIYDYEAPYGQTVTYVASTSGPTITSDPVLLNIDTPWLVHPGIPSLSQPLWVVSLGDRTKDTNQGIFRALGRKNAIVVSDGQRQSAAYDLTVAITDAGQASSMDQLLDDVSPLLLQIVYPGTTRSVYNWVTVGEVTESDVSTWFAQETSQWTLPCTITDAPSGLLQAQRTWANLIAECATWRNVVATFATWRDVITDNTD